MGKKKQNVGQVPCYTIVDQIYRMRQGDCIAYISVFLRFNLQHVEELGMLIEVIDRWSRSSVITQSVFSWLMCFLFTHWFQFVFSKYGWCFKIRTFYIKIIQTFTLFVCFWKTCNIWQHLFLYGNRHLSYLSWGSSLTKLYPLLSILIPCPF